MSFYDAEAGRKDFLESRQRLISSGLVVRDTRPRSPETDAMISGTRIFLGRIVGDSQFYWIFLEVLLKNRRRYDTTDAQEGKRVLWRDELFEYWVAILRSSSSQARLDDNDSELEFSNCAELREFLDSSDISWFSNVETEYFAESSDISPDWI